MTIEILEARIAPAAVVGITYDDKTGDLTLVGDAVAASAISIHALDTKGMYRIEGLGGTEIGAGVAFRDLPKLRNITYTGGAQVDSIHLTGINTKGFINLDTGDGAATIVLTDLTVGQGLTLASGDGFMTTTATGSKLSVGGDLTITHGAGGSSNALGADSVMLKKQLLFSGGAGDDVLTSGDFSDLTVKGGIKFEGHGGADTLLLKTLGDISLGKLTGTGQSVLATNTGTGQLDVTLSAGVILKLAGFLETTVDAASTGLTLEIRALTASINGKNADGNSLVVQGGNADDTITLGGALFTTKGGLLMDLLAGQSEVNLGDKGALTLGKNKLGLSVELTTPGTFSRLTLSGAAAFYSGDVIFDVGNGGSLLTVDALVAMLGGLTYTGGDGVDQLNLTGTIIVKGDLFMSGGVGDDALLAQPGSTVAAGSFLFSGGDNDDTVDLSPVILGAGNMTVDLGDGTNSLTVRTGKFAVGSLTLEGGTGDDTAEINAALGVSATFDLNLASGQNSANFAFGKFTGGSVSMTSGDGDDSFSFSANQLTLAGGVTFTTAGGDDTVILAGAGTVKGNVTVDLGGSTAAGLQHFSAAGGLSPATVLKIGGGLTVTSTGSTGSTEEFSLQRVAVTKNVLLAGSDAATTFTLDNLNTLNLTIAGGAGADKLAFERNNVFGKSIVKGTALIDLGTEDDVISIGVALGVNNSVDFLGAVTIDDAGGANDTINANIGTVNTFKKTKEFNLVKFETQV